METLRYQLFRFFVLLNVFVVFAKTPHDAKSPQFTVVKVATKIFGLIVLLDEMILLLLLDTTKPEG